jgi:hypothetical protein
MMKIIVNRNTLELISEEEFRQIHQNISFPVALSNSAIENTDFVLVEAPPQQPLPPHQSAEIVISSQGEEVVASYNIITQLPPLNVLLKTYEEAIDNLIDSKAKEYNYSNVYTMISYRGDPNPKFNQEAESMFLWRSQVWTTANTILQGYITSIGENPLDPESLPSIQSILAALPPFVLVGNE